MPFIRRCSTQRNMRIRVLASRALTGLVSNEKLPGVIVDIATELSCLENHCSGIAISHKFSSTNEAQHTPFNLIHGMLLQLCSLLDTNCRNLVDFSKDQILSDLIQLLAKCSWIGSPKWCPCPPVNTTFFRVLDHMLSLARGCRSGETIFHIRNLLLELTAECLVLDGSCVLPYYDPAVSELREQSASSYFSCFFQESNKKTGENNHLSQKNGLSDINLLAPLTLGAPCQLQEKLVCCLSDSLYEVRLATLKWLLKFLRIAESGCHGHYNSSSEMAAVQQWTDVNLQDTIMKLLSLEKNHKCTRYILRIFYSWNLQQYNQVGSETNLGTKFVGVMDSDSTLQIWGRLLSLYNIVRHAKTRGTLICCMAVCIKRLGGLLANSIFDGIEKTINERLVQLERQNQLYGCICMYNKLIELHSGSSEPVNLRNAAAESIIASGMLEQAEVIGPLFCNKMPAESRPSFSDTKEIAIMFAHQVLKMWFTCVRLLEDEDDGIRQKLALNVQKCFTPRQLLGRSGAFNVPTQVEKVLILSFEHLSSIFGHWIEYFNYLAQWVHDMEKYEKSAGDLVRRVFDKEIDNHHEEKLLICQICCLHMEKLFTSSFLAVNSTEEDSIKKNLYAWRTRFFTQLMTFGEDHMTNEDVFWIGGVGNHKDAFLLLYANLLGFYALSKCLLSEDDITSDPELVSDVVKLAKALSLFLRNPLILNLFCLVVELHERKFNLSADISILKYRTDDLLWDCFDPYFLLK
ncbi:hypothetical protein BT93_A0155 [Corymbia citriodora subsp. variegata]|nr:hypothetical protein BT93_A0155 [Corymbia citriodora subsp. variegata]